MIRFFLIGAVVASVLFFCAALVGRAMDVEIQERVLFTRDGVTFDCERRWHPEGELIEFEDGSSVRAHEGGETTYNNCHEVP
jgi:hypothetical protein